MTCGRCGLSVRLRGPRLNLDRCPRCFAFAGVSVPLNEGRLPVVLGGSLSATLPLTPTATAAGASTPTASSGGFGHLVVCTHQDGPVTVITVQGKLDIASERCLAKALERAADLGCERMVIDLRALEFIDGVGLKALLRARERAIDDGHDLVLVKGPANVQRMFELTDTLDLFRFEP
jgi:anti-sigma B factor antagonist